MLLYQNGVDEQLVMELTGHRSVYGVRSYKQPSSQQRQELSNIPSLNKRTCIAEMQHTSTPEAENSANHPPLLCSLHFSGCSSITINIVNNKTDQII